MGLTGCFSVTFFLEVGGDSLRDTLIHVQLSYTVITIHD